MCSYSMYKQEYNIYFDTYFDTSLTHTLTHLLPGIKSEFPEPGEALDLGHPGFSSFLHGFAHLEFAFSVLGTTKSEAKSAKSQEVSIKKRPNLCGKIR